MTPSSQLIRTPINLVVINFVYPAKRWETTLYFSECLAACLTYHRVRHSSNTAGV